MSISLRINLHHKKYVDGTQAVVIECSNTVKSLYRCRRRIICKIKADQFDWENRRVKDHPNEVLLNTLISKTLHEADTRLHTWQLHDRPFELAAVIDSKAPAIEHQTTFLGYGCEYVERCRLKGHSQTADKYTGHLTRLSQYIDQLPLGNQKDVYLNE